VKNITSYSSATVKFNSNGYRNHDPDVSFGHNDAKYPGFILEVLCSQKRKDLPRLAEDYILGLNGSIRAVVGLDLEYHRVPTDAKTSVMVCFHMEAQITTDLDMESKLTVGLIADVEFRDKFGSPVNELSLRLADFAVPELYAGEIPGSITIPAQTLVNFLGRAETATAKSKSSTAATLNQTLKRQRGTPTPDDVLDEVTDSTIREEVERVGKKLQKDDPTYG